MPCSSTPKGAAVALLVVCLIAFAAVGHAAATGDRSAENRNVTVGGAIGLAAFVALSDAHLQKMADSLSILATSDAARRGDWERIKGPLAALGKRNVEALNWYAAPDGTYWSVQKGKEPANLAQRDYMQAVLAGETVIGALVRSYGANKPVAIVAVPVRDEAGETTGVLGASVYLDRLSQRIGQELDLGEGMIFFAIDQSGRTTLDWDPSLIFRRPDGSGEEDVARAMREMLSREQGSVSYRFRGRDRSVLFKRSPVTGWSHAFGIVPAGREAPGSPAAGLGHEELAAFAKRAADKLEQEGQAAFDALREPGGEWFRGDQYVFVWGLDGHRYVYPPDPAAEGQNMLGLKDVNGKPIGAWFVQRAAVEPGHAWVHYEWPRPHGLFPVWKSTYIQRAVAPDGQRYLVGAGQYDMPLTRDLLSGLVDDAVRLLEQEGQAAFARLRDPADAFSFMDTYVFVLDPDGTELVNPAFPNLEGRNLMEYEDAAGNRLVEEMITRTEQGDGAWVEYYWPRPGSAEPVRKVAHVRRVRVNGDEWVVGAGMYEPK